jgi:opacity protein-like surface antigen
MVRMSRLALPAVMAFVILGAASPAAAQLTGWFTVHAGQTFGGDTTENGATYGVSMAAFEARSWLGADVDFAHSMKFNDERFTDSGLTTIMANVIVSPPRLKFQPYALVGAGAIRVRGCVADCVRTLSKTEFGLDAGGGLQYQINDFIAVRGELRYFRILEQIEDLPRTASGSFDFFRFSGGLTFTWPAM